MAADDASSQAGSGAAGASAGLTAGTLLRQAREARGLAREQLAGELRIEVKHLLALEEDRFQAIGPPVFAKGYLKQYGQRLGVESRALLAAYDAQVRGQDQEIGVLPKHPIRLRDERQIGVWIAAIGALVLLGGLLAYWSLGLQLAGQSPSGGQPIEVAPDPRPAAPTIGGEIAPLEEEALPEPATTIDDVVPDEPSPGVARSSVLAAGPLAAATQPLADPAGLWVTLQFTDDSWVEISDASGERLYYGLGRAGTRAEFGASPPLDVLLGNVDGVSIQIDGMSFAIPRASRRGPLARFTVNPSE